MKKVSSKKGFTLAELLIVVAIIAVLVAIAIPVFNSSLEKAKYAADCANIRATYAQVVNDYLAKDGEAVSLTTTEKMQTSGSAYKIPGTSETATWSAKDQVVQITVAADGSITASAS